MNIFSKKSKDQKYTRIITRREDYAYCTGRFRSLETSLLGNGTMNRIFDAADTGEIARILTENGFTVSGQIRKAVSDDLIASYDLARKLIPDKEYIDALVCVNDYHNIKVILKSFIPGSSFSANSSSDPELGLIDPQGAMSDFFASGNRALNDDEIIPNFMMPARHDPLTLFNDIRNSRGIIEDKELMLTIEDAFRAYVRTSDPGDIDDVVDVHYFDQMTMYDKMLGNDFFHEFVSFKADSTNLSMILRLRAMKADPSRIRSVCVSGGEVSPEEVIDSYDSSPEVIKALFRPSCGELVDLKDNYGMGHTALEFGKAVDNRIISMLYKTKFILFGPEIISAFLIAKEMQAKNINIALTCVRNDVPKSLAAEMMRDSF